MALRRSSRQRRTTDLDTPLSLYLKETYSLRFPARFYDPKTIKPYVNVKTPDAAPLIELYEKGISKLSAKDIAAAYVLENIPSGYTQKSALLPYVEVLKEYGIQLSIRFGVETEYSTYSVSQLELDRETLESIYKAQKEYERRLSDGIEAANSQVQEYPAAMLTRPEIQRSNLVFTRVSWNEANVDRNKIRDRDFVIHPIVDKARLMNEDAPDVFNLIPVSGEKGGIPYLGYHTPTSNRYRVATTPYPGEVTHPSNEEYNYKSISDSIPYKSELRESTSFLSFIIRGIFGFIDLSHSTLILNQVTRDNEDLITDKVKELFPFLRIEGLSQRRINARILSPIGGPISYHLLYFDAMLYQEPYIGFKEENKDNPQLLKPTKMFYLSPVPRIVDPLTDKYAAAREEIKIVMNNKTAANPEVLSLYRPGEKGYKPYDLQRGTTYVELTLDEVSDTDMLHFASVYISRMLGRYYEIVVPQFGHYITKDFQLPLNLTSDSSADAIYSRTANIRKIDRLSHDYPEVFSNNYTRQCPQYPTVKSHLDAEDIEYQSGSGSDDDGGKGKWIKYPPDGGIEFYFRCGIEDPLFQYPGVKVSKLKNRAKYPVIPCCFRTNQFKEGTRTEIEYRLGSSKASSISDLDINSSAWGSLKYPPSFNPRLLSSDRILSRGRLGGIPEGLLTVIKNNILESGEDDDEEERRIVRLGLSETNLVHACFLAIDPEYQKLSTATVEERLAYLRKKIEPNLPDPACLYQELQVKEATANVLLYEDENNHIFKNWGTTTHYRILEEILGVNIYVIIRISPRENVAEPNRYKFELPSTRSGYPHMRRHQLSKPSIILYRVRKFEGELEVDSGVELLLHSYPGKPFSGIWGNGSTVKIAELYNRTAQVLSFGTSPLDNEYYSASLGLYTADYISSIRATPISQLIDEKGLCRALSFDDNGSKFSIVFPATQPYNLPFSVELFRTSYEPLVRRIFGEATLTSFNRDGVFYTPPGDPTRYIFVPLIEDDDTLDRNIPKTSYTPLSGLEPNAVDYSVQLSTAITYLRVLLFMFSFVYAFSDIRDPKMFMEAYVLLDESRHRPYVKDIYDFDGLKRTITLRDRTLKEVFETIKRLAPTLLDSEGKKLVLTSQKIYQCIEYFIRTAYVQTLAEVPERLRKKVWNLEKVISPVREEGNSSSVLLSRDIGKDNEDKEHSTINFGKVARVRMWFKNTRGEGAGSMNTTSEVNPVVDVVRDGTGVVLFRHPKSNRLWLIPGITDSLRNTCVLCYIWNTEYRIIPMETQLSSAAVIKKLEIQSGVAPAKGSRITALFRRRSKENQREEAFTSTKEDEDLISQVKHILDTDERIRINKYVITRNNLIEYLRSEGDARSPPEGGYRMIIDVLLTASQRYTPMLSP